MKKYVALILLLTVLCSFTSCIDKHEEPASSVSHIQTDVDTSATEGIVLNKSKTIYADVVEKISPDILVVKLRHQDAIEEWGTYVNVIAEDIDKWCVDDIVAVKFRIFERPANTEQRVRVVADEIYNAGVVYKPIIYLYPEESTVCSVKVDLDGELICTYPEHATSGWQDFVAYPDSTLIFPDGKEYYALYWEGITGIEWDMTKGFCVRGEDTAEFLEWALAEQGLTRREANEFIVYWLPLMQENPYNVISFQTDRYTDSVKLDITPAPDSLLRVYMTYYAANEAIEIEPQSFERFERQGFTVVEWGGGIIEKSK